MYECTVTRRKDGSVDVVYVNELGIDIHVRETCMMDALDRIARYGARIVKDEKEV